MNQNTNVTKTNAGENGVAEKTRPALTPAVDIIENDVGITLLADLPGVSKERLGVKVDGDTLLIEGSAEVRVPDNLQFVYGEIRNPHFRRSFTLSRELDASKIEANLRDGVLRLHIPKAEAARPRRIEVNAG
jgi:HSP20 family protein